MDLPRGRRVRSRSGHVHRDSIEAAPSGAASAFPASDAPAEAQNPQMPTGADETARVRAIWDRLAPTYDRSAGFEAWLLRDGRAWVIGQATGKILEIAIGTGRNLPLYPAGARLTGFDIS